MEYTICGGVLIQIDECDLSHVEGHSWHLAGFNRRYVARTALLHEGKKRQIYLHRELLGFPDGEVDHVNRDTLDNRRANLRIVTRSGNEQNRPSCGHGKTGVRGVYFSSSRKKYVGEVYQHGRRVLNKGFDSLTEAEAAVRTYRAAFQPCSPEAMARRAL